MPEKSRRKGDETRRVLFRVCHAHGHAVLKPAHQLRRKRHVRVKIVRMPARVSFLLQQRQEEEVRAPPRSTSARRWGRRPDRRRLLEIEGVDERSPASTRAGRSPARNRAGCFLRNSVSGAGTPRIATVWKRPSS